MKNSESIEVKAMFVHMFRAYIEGNLFSTKIWVVAKFIHWHALNSYSASRQPDV